MVIGIPKEIMHGEGRVAAIPETVAKLKADGFEVLVEKTPIDGLCGKTDEDAFGFSYTQLDKYLRTGETDNTALTKIQYKERTSTFKRREIPKYQSGIKNFGDW